MDPSQCFLHVSYAAIDVFLVFRINSLTGAGRRAGELAIVNLIFPLSATHLNYLADVLGITWRTCRRIHCATGWMAVALLSFHIIATVQARQFSFPLGESQILFTMVVCLIPVIIPLQLTSGRVLHHCPCSAFSSMVSSMVVRDLFSRASDPHRALYRGPGGIFRPKAAP